MDTIKRLFTTASKTYNRQMPHYALCLELVLYCHQKLRAKSEFRHYGYFSGNPRVAYGVFALDDSVSRPVRNELYLSDEATFTREHREVIALLRDRNHTWTPADYEKVNRVIYTAIMAFACCYDLWKRSSRKTPGTFFEVFMAGLLQIVFPEATFSKHIPLAAIVADDEVASEAVSEAADDGPLEIDDDDEKSSVSTDVVMGLPGKSGGIVIPLKITTRERIVQPFAHQRILDAAFGEGHYKSMIVCISETQLDDKTKSVKQVCVPGTIKLFQKHLAPTAGMYYCDVPQRYAAADMTKIVNVRSVGHLFEDIRSILAALTSQGKAD